MILSRVSPHLSIYINSSRYIFAETIIAIVISEFYFYCCMQSRIHEVWVRTFSSTLGETIRYTPSDCFETFPFPPGFETDPALEAAGRAYYDHRAALMVARNEGMTKTYNRFHNPAETGPDIVRLRELHAEMDRAVLCAYGWSDLADMARPEFIEQDADEGKTPKTRLDWPSDFKDEVLARLLALNVERAAAGGAAVGPDEDDAEDDAP